MKIALIGTGISGLTAAWRRRREHETLLDTNDCIDGQVVPQAE